MRFGDWFLLRKSVCVVTWKLGSGGGAVGGRATGPVPLRVFRWRLIYVTVCPQGIRPLFQGCNYARRVLLCDKVECSSSGDESPNADSHLVLASVN